MTKPAIVDKTYYENRKQELADEINGLETAIATKRIEINIFENTLASEMVKKDDTLYSIIDSQNSLLQNQRATMKTREQLTQLANGERELAKRREDALSRLKQIETEEQEFVRAMFEEAEKQQQAEIAQMSESLPFGTREYPVIAQIDASEPEDEECSGVCNDCNNKKTETDKLQNEAINFVKKQVSGRKRRKFLTRPKRRFHVPCVVKNGEVTPLSDFETKPNVINWNFHLEDCKVGQFPPKPMRHDIPEYFGNGQYVPEIVVPGLKASGEKALQKNVAILGGETADELAERQGGVVVKPGTQRNDRPRSIFEFYLREEVEEQLHLTIGCLEQLKDVDVITGYLNVGYSNVDYKRRIRIWLKNTSNDAELYNYLQNATGKPIVISALNGQNGYIEITAYLKDDKSTTLTFTALVEDMKDAYEDLYFNINTNFTEPNDEEVIDYFTNGAMWFADGSIFIHKDKYVFLSQSVPTNQIIKVVCSLSMDEANKKIARFNPNKHPTEFATRHATNQVNLNELNRLASAKTQIYIREARLIHDSNVELEVSFLDDDKRYRGTIFFIQTTLDSLKKLYQDATEQKRSQKRDAEFMEQIKENTNETNVEPNMEEDKGLQQLQQAKTTEFKPYIDQREPEEVLGKLCFNGKHHVVTRLNSEEFFSNWNNYEEREEWFKSQGFDGLGSKLTDVFIYMDHMSNKPIQVNSIENGDEFVLLNATFKHQENDDFKPELQFAIRKDEFVKTVKQLCIEAITPMIVALTGEKEEVKETKEEQYGCFARGSFVATNEYNSWIDEHEDCYRFTIIANGEILNCKIAAKEVKAKLHQRGIIEDKEPQAFIVWRDLTDAGEYMSIISDGIAISHGSSSHKLQLTIQNNDERYRDLVFNATTSNDNWATYRRSIKVKTVGQNIPLQQEQSAAPTKPAAALVDDKTKEPVETKQLMTTKEVDTALDNLWNSRTAFHTMLKFLKEGFVLNYSGLHTPNKPLHPVGAILDLSVCQGRYVIPVTVVNRYDEANAMKSEVYLPSDKDGVNTIIGVAISQDNQRILFNFYEGVEEAIRLSADVKTLKDLDTILFDKASDTVDWFKQYIATHPLQMSQMINGPFNGNLSIGLYFGGPQLLWADVKLGDDDSDKAKIAKINELMNIFQHNVMEITKVESERTEETPYKRDIFQHRLLLELRSTTNKDIVIPCSCYMTSLDGFRITLIHADIAGNWSVHNESKTDKVVETVKKDSDEEKEAGRLALEASSKHAQAWSKLINYLSNKGIMVVFSDAVYSDKMKPGEFTTVKDNKLNIELNFELLQHEVATELKAQGIQKTETHHLPSVSFDYKHMTFHLLDDCQTILVDVYHYNSVTKKSIGNHGEPARTFKISVDDVYQALCTKPYADAILETDAWKFLVQKCFKSDGYIKNTSEQFERVKAYPQLNPKTGLVIDGVTGVLQCEMISEDDGKKEYNISVLEDPDNRFYIESVRCDTIPDAIEIVISVHAPIRKLTFFSPSNDYIELCQVYFKTALLSVSQWWNRHEESKDIDDELMEVVTESKTTEDEGALKSYEEWVSGHEYKQGPCFDVEHPTDGDDGLRLPFVLEPVAHTGLLVDNACPDFIDNSYFQKVMSVAKASCDKTNIQFNYDPLNTGKPIASFMRAVHKHLHENGLLLSYIDQIRNSKVGLTPTFNGFIIGFYFFLPVSPYGDENYVANTMNTEKGFFWEPLTNKIYLVVAKREMYDETPTPAIRLAFVTTRQQLDPSSTDVTYKHIGAINFDGTAVFNYASQAIVWEYPLLDKNRPAN